MLYVRLGPRRGYSSLGGRSTARAGVSCMPIACLTRARFHRCGCCLPDALVAGFDPSRSRFRGARGLGGKSAGTADQKAGERDHERKHQDGPVSERGQYM